MYYTLLPVLVIFGLDHLLLPPVYMQISIAGGKGGAHRCTVDLAEQLFVKEKEIALQASQDQLDRKDICVSKASMVKSYNLINMRRDMQQM